jgi:hypothetical protein
VSVPFSPLPNPFNDGPTYNLPSIPDVRSFLWNYRLIRSLQTDFTGGQLVHRPYYRPYSSLLQGPASFPFINGGTHHFEWLHPIHQSPIVVIVLSIDPSFDFSYPSIKVIPRRFLGLPSIHISYWDCPASLPHQVFNALEKLSEDLHPSIITFGDHLIEFLEFYFQPIQPYEDVNSLLLLDHSPNIPVPPLNPNFIPLVSNQK